MVYTLAALTLVCATAICIAVMVLGVSKKDKQISALRDRVAVERQVNELFEIEFKLIRDTPGNENASNAASVLETAEEIRASYRQRLEETQ